jgi:hypothetical protein
MKLPAINGLIRRRILVNYRVKPEVIQPLLPAKFRPKLHGEFAIAGICLIRLEQIRVKGLPAFTGVSSENAAHRIAVTWEDYHGKPQEGVYIPRRDTDSRLNQFAGGRFFPGEHHAAEFEVRDDGDRIDFSMASKDGDVAIKVRGRTAKELPAESAFKDVKAVSEFFERGSLGYSATAKGNRLEGMRLKTATWEIEPLAVEHVHSSFFADKLKFPAGSVQFDCALLMRNIKHEWVSEQNLYI